MILYSEILTRFYPAAEWSMSGEDYTQLVWLSQGAKPSQSDLDLKWPETQTLMASEVQKVIDAKASRDAKLAKMGFTKDEIDNW